MVQPSTVNGTELGAQEWRDALFLQYGLETPDLPHYCNGHNATFSIFHAPDYELGGLVRTRYNEIRYGVSDLAGKAFTLSHVRDDPLIFAGCAVMRPKENTARSKATTVPSTTPRLESTEQKGVLLIHDLW